MVDYLPVDAFTVTLAVIHVDVLVLVVRSADRRILVDVGADRAAIRYVRIDVRVHVLRCAGRDVCVQVRVVRRTCSTTLVKIPIGICGRRCAVVEIPIGVEIGAVNRAGRGAVDRLINRAGRNIRILIDICCRAGGRILIDVGQRPRLDIVIRVDVRRCRRAGRCRDIVIVVRVRAGSRRCRRIHVRISICRCRSCRRVVDVVGGLGDHHARPANCNEN